MLQTVLLVAIVVEPNVALRASAQEHAVRQAPLQRGDWLEVRGERVGYVNVYDHARERPGYVRARDVRTYEMTPSSLPALAAVLDLLRDSPGQEALGMGYVALYLKAAGTQQVPSTVWDALGTMADRLARRASVNRTTDVSLAADLDVAARYGVRFVNVEQDGRTVLCYDGEAHRRTLALQGNPNARVRAALALTREACPPPSMTQAQRTAWNDWRAEVLSQVDTLDVAPWMANRLWMRRVEVYAQQVFARGQARDAAGAVEAAQAALNALARVQRAELAEEDRSTLETTVMRANLARLALQTPVHTGNLVDVTVTTGEPGQTCITLRRGETTGAPRCTYGVVWEGSVKVLPQGKAVTLVVQPLAGWSEVWMARPNAQGWSWNVVVPSASSPGLGYADVAGFSPDGKYVLVAREATATPENRHLFEQVNVETLKVEHLAHDPKGFRPFRLWALPAWRQEALAMR